VKKAPRYPGQWSRPAKLSANSGGFGADLRERSVQEAMAQVGGQL
jgi:hypothetical protein